MSRRERARRLSPLLLGGLLGAAGVLHFVTPGFFDQIVPSALPNPRLWTYLSGVAELGVAAAVVNPGTRRAGGFAAAALFVAVFPANVQHALQAEGAEQTVALLRLPLQVPLVLWGLQVARAARR